MARRAASGTAATKETPKTSCLRQGPQPLHKRVRQRLHICCNFCQLLRLLAVRCRRLVGHPAGARHAVAVLQRRRQRARESSCNSQRPNQVARWPRCANRNLAAHGLVGSPQLTMGKLKAPTCSHVSSGLKRRRPTTSMKYRPSGRGWHSTISASHATWQGRAGGSVAGAGGMRCIRRASAVLVPPSLLPRAAASPFAAGPAAAAVAAAAAPPPPAPARTSLSRCWRSTVPIPKRRLPSMQRRTIRRYRGSKMFSAMRSPAEWAFEEVAWWVKRTGWPQAQ